MKMHDAFNLFMCFFNKFRLLPPVTSQDAFPTPSLYPTSFSLRNICTAQYFIEKKAAAHSGYFLLPTKSNYR